MKMKKNIVFNYVQVLPIRQIY